METHRDQQPELRSSAERRARAVVGAALIAVTALAAGVLWYLTRPPPPVSDRLLLHRVAFADLAGWDDDHQAAAMVALRLSCAPLLARAGEVAVGPDGIGGTAAEWRPACEAAARLATADDGAARRFLEAHFVPLGATNNGEAEGLFTGYYEPELRGGRLRQGGDAVPLYATPPDLVTVDLGQFRDSLKNQRIAGRVVAGRLEPFPDRAAIDGGALAKRGLEIAWVEDPIDAFFLHIQGSGRIALDDGSTMRVGYAAQNGHPYVAIGRELVADGEIDPEMVSLQSIRAWLRAHPDSASAMMAKNRSYVFFRELDEAGPVGAQGAVLTPRRSLAVDRRFVPLGAPVWLDARAPAADREGAEVVLRRLMISQDTGGAIRGPVRGDVFWGHGAEAEAVAGRMRHRGRYYLLLPVAVVERLERAGRIDP